MTWVRLDDGFPDHPKIIEAGLAGRCLFIDALCWSAQHLTDGFVSKTQGGLLADRVVALLAAERGLRPNQMRGTRAKLLRRMSAVGLWKVVDGGYQIPDFLNYNPSKAEVEEQRAKRAEAGRRGGIASGATRRMDAEDRSKRPSKREANASQIVRDPLKQNRTPAPSPTPTPNPRGVSDSSNGDEERTEPDADFDIAKATTIEKLATMISGEEDKTRLRRLGEQVSLFAVEKVFESAINARMNNPNAYILSSLADEARAARIRRAS